MKKVFAATSLIVGSIIGAGFASGRELSLFFAEFGWNSLYFLPIVFILFYYLFKLFLSFGANQKFENVFEINKLAGSSPFFNVAVIVIFLIYAAAMFAGAVEVLSNNFIGVPNIIFQILVFALAFFVLKFGFSGLVKVNGVLIPIIVILLIVYSLYSALVPITNIPYIPESTGAHILPISIIIYCFGNILLSYFIVAEAGHGLSKKQIQKTAFFAALVICFTLLICIICLIINGTVVMDASMPFLVLTLRLGDPFPWIFMSILFLGIITSLFGCLHTASLPFKQKFGKHNTIFCTTFVFVISLLGFDTIVNNFYPIIGIFGTIIVVKILLWNHQRANT